MSRLREDIHQKRTELWKKQSWHHDNVPQLLYSSGLALLTFSLLKTEGTDVIKAFGYDCGDKRKIITRAVGDNKKRVSRVL